MGRVVLPLSWVNIYETAKINKFRQRKLLGQVQSSLSQGVVFRGRNRRVSEELSSALADICHLDAPELPPKWFLSNAFIEAFSEANTDEPGSVFPEQIGELIRQNPSEALYSYFVHTPENDRVNAVRQFSAGAGALRQRVELRRSHYSDQTMEMRRRAYSAHLMIDELDRIMRIARNCGAHWHSVQDIGPDNAQKIMTQVSTYYVERELALRIESQRRPLSENDFRDMDAYCAAIPYANLIVGEKQFINLARQAGLDKKYNTSLETNISALCEFLTAL